MAKKAKEKEVKVVPARDSLTDEEGLMQEAVKRFDRSVDNERDERDAGNADIDFINSTDQWDDSAKAARGPGRVTLTINTLPTFLDQIDGDMRQSRPGITVRPAGDDSTKETADTIEGIIRYIERKSKATRVYAYGGLHAAAGGRGAWRVRADYISDTSLKQTILIERIDNPYSVYYDPSALRDDKQDGNYFFLVSDISRDEFKETFPGKNPVDFSSGGNSALSNWNTNDNVRVAEYFYKKKVDTNHLCLLTDGRTMKKEDLKDEELSLIAREREVPVFEIWWAKIDGKQILEGPQKVAGKMFPVVLTWGKQLCVKGKIESRGIARFAKDSCRLYNYFRTTQAETQALQPKQPYLMPDICLGPYKDIWDKANSELLPYLPFHVDADNAMQWKPYREHLSDLSPGTSEQIAIAKGEIRDTVGIQKAALGMESNETSGRAIRERKMETDSGQFAYLDNMADAVCTTGKIINSMIPEIFDTEQVVRIIGKDMKESGITVNSLSSNIYLTSGEYEIDITTDKSYSTQREELIDKLQTILPNMSPEFVSVISYFLFDALDIPKSEQISKVLRKMLPPGLIEDETPTATDGESSPAGGGNGKAGSPPPPVATPAPPPTPDPLQVVKVRQEEIIVKQEEAKLEGIELENEIKRAKLKQLMEEPHRDVVSNNESVLDEAGKEDG